MHILFRANLKVCQQLGIKSAYPNVEKQSVESRLVESFYKEHVISQK